MVRPVCLPWQRFSIPHSSVIFSTVTSGNPPCREACSLSLSHIPPLFAASLFLLPPPQFSLFLSFPPSLSLPLRPLFISELGKSCVTPTPPKPSFYFPSLSFENFLHNVTDRGPLTRHLSQYSQSEHTSCCYHEKVTTLSWSLNVSLRCIFFLY